MTHTSVLDTLCFVCVNNDLHETRPSVHRTDQTSVPSTGMPSSTTAQPKLRMRMRTLHTTALRSHQLITHTSGMHSNTQYRSSAVKFRLVRSVCMSNSICLIIMKCFVVIIKSFLLICVDMCVAGLTSSSGSYKALQTLETGHTQHTLTLSHERANGNNNHTHTT